MRMTRVGEAELAVNSAMFALSVAQEAHRAEIESRGYIELSAAAVADAKAELAAAQAEYSAARWAQKSRASGIPLATVVQEPVMSAIVASLRSVRGYRPALGTM